MNDTHTKKIQLSRAFFLGGLIFWADYNLHIQQLSARETKLDIQIKEKPIFCHDYYYYYYLNEKK